MSSSSAFRVHTHVAYASAKAGLAQLTRSVAAELAPYGVNVSTVAPGITRTPMAQVRQGPTANLFGRLSAPEDVAEAIVFLCLPGSRQITAQVIHTSAGTVV